jgi:sugar lactone lactonase YvrE
MGLLYDAAIVKFNLTDADVHEASQAMAVDESGNVFLAISSGLLVLNEETEILGKLDTPTPITSLALGDDKFLYITTSNQLLRIRVRQGPPKLPTNLVKRSKYFAK